MKKFTIIWRSGEIFHVICPDRMDAIARIPDSLWHSMSFLERQNFVVVDHDPKTEDFENPNCVVNLESGRGTVWQEP